MKEKKSLVLYTKFGTHLKIDNRDIKMIAILSEDARINHTYLAQSLNFGNQTIQGPLDKSVDSLGKIITKTLGFIMPMAGIVLLFVLISGGYDYMMSQGNADKIKSAQAKITSGIIGFILLIVSFLITRLIAVIFGLGGGIF